MIRQILAAFLHLSNVNFILCWSNSPLLWRHKKQNLETSYDQQEEQKTEETARMKAKKKVKEEKKSLKRQVSEKDREEKRIKVRSAWILFSVGFKLQYKRRLFKNPSRLSAKMFLCWWLCGQDGVWHFNDDFTREGWAGSWNEESEGSAEARTGAVQVKFRPADPRGAEKNEGGAGGEAEGEQRILTCLYIYYYRKSTI